MSLRLCLLLSSYFNYILTIIILFWTELAALLISYQKTTGYIIPITHLLLS